MCARNGAPSETTDPPGSAFRPAGPGLCDPRHVHPSAQPDPPPGVIPVRDSKAPHGPTLAFRRQAWAAFAEDLKADRQAHQPKIHQTP
ncbi:DUF397 domain-containing protein [Streptomyces griseoluteus]|uniref:DUF397 domain-containing protein n=1 Tax=Streptomyces griseoluteus TaxID=29306 RepID=UPI0036F99A58